MRALGQLTTHVAGLSCLAILVIACFGGVLLRGEQFAFRDSAHYFYPLFHRVQAEWAAGRLPLWEPEENGGTPILGNPTAAVFYPGKLIFALLPFAWAMRLFVVAHLILAFACALALVRSWGASWIGAYLGGLTYAFGGPVLSDYYNVIYLVGAAWTPLGFLCADRWLRLGRKFALIELSIVLAMQILGGDPEAAYLTVICAFGYSIVLSGSTARPWFWAVIAGIVAGWLWIGPHVASRIHGFGELSVQTSLSVAWSLGILLFVATRRREEGRPVSTMLAGLAASSALALGLAAVQVLPAIDSISQSVRWNGSGIPDRFELSLLPYRAIEWIWPKVFGSFSDGNHYWESLLPPTDAHRPSPLSLYVGALPLLLAIGAAGFRKGPAWLRLMSTIAVVSFLASFGEFAGFARWSSALPTSASGEDSFYGLCTTVLPAFRLFRFPNKLLVLTSMAIAVLTGIGWDRIADGTVRRRVAIAGLVLVLITGAALSAAVWRRTPIALAIAADPHAENSVFGPIDAQAAVGELLAALAHGSVALASGLVLVVCCRYRPRAAGLASLFVLTADLALASAGLVLTVPQTDFDRVPEVVQAIQAAERTDPSPSPFRVHRLEPWVPTGWSKTASPQRIRELADWELDTLQPKFGLLHGINYVLSDDSETGRADYRDFFQPAMRTLDGRSTAALGISPGRGVLYYPRRAFDLWGARYFILPSYPSDWTEPNRGYAAFLEQTEMIYPDPARLEGSAQKRDRERWLETRDVQVRRNKAVFPRAWIVHDAKLIRPLGQFARAVRGALSVRLGFPPDPAQNQSILADVDLRAMAYIETENPDALAPFLPGRVRDPAESVKVKDEGPTRVVIETALIRPGLIVLADTFDTNWRLSIDGRSAEILKANVLMRAAAVTAGAHTLDFTYEPRCVRLGVLVSLASLLVLVGVSFYSLRR